MAIKCICFCRVSTEAQDLDAQIERVVASAIADGYKQSEIAIVKGKESAIKLKEEQRETINEMKEIISENPHIESVYVFAIDRLARRVAVILSVKEYLLEHKINLVFLNPHKMGTLRKNEDGELVEDELTSLLLMLLSYGAEMEMKIKKARFATSKAALKKQGKIASGTVMYGYVKLDDNSIGINDKEAQVVRLIYQWYNNENISLQGIYKRLVNKGIWNNTILSNSAATRVRLILSNPAYYGGVPLQRTKGKKGIVRTEKYPAIITEEAQKIALSRLSNNTKPKSSSKNIYYGKGLVRFELDDTHSYMMSPVRRNTAYMLNRDGFKVGISVNVIDMILWQDAIEYRAKSMFLDKESTRQTYTLTIEENERVIETLKPNLNEVNSKKQKAFRMYINGGVSEENYNAVIKEIDNAKDMYEKQIAKLENANESMRMLLNEIDSSKNLNPQAIGLITDDEERVEIIKSVIQKVSVKRLDDEKRTQIIRVVPIDALKPFDMGEYYEYWVRGGVFHLFLCHDGRKKDISDLIQKRILPYNRAKKQKML